MTDPNEQDAARKTARNEDLIERYVSAVARRLPAKQAKDIAAELREAVFARVEEKERELGRPVERKEVAEIIKTFGSPMLAAARYEGRQYLLGPDIFPYYWPVARLVVGIVAAVAIVGFLVQGVLSDDPVRYALRGVGAAWTGALWSFAVVTGVFIALDRGKAGASFEKSWRPETLPAETTFKPKSLFESLFSLAWDAIFIAWWVGLVHFPNTLPGEPGQQGLRLDFDPTVWSTIFVLVLAMSVVTAAIHLFDVFHPTWTRVRSIAMLATVAIGLSCIWLMGQAHVQLLMVHGPAEAADRVNELNTAFDVVSKVMIYGLAIGFGIAAVVEGWRLARSFQIEGTASQALPRG